MKIEIYVNWDEKEILQPEDYKARMGQLINEYKQDKNEFLFEVLSDYTDIEIYNLSKEERNKIEELTEARICRRVKQDMEEDWEKITIEI